MTDAMPVGDRQQLAPPVDDSGALGWVRKNLFSSWGNGITTVVLIVAVGWILSWFLEWAVFTANFTATSGSECRGQGACWALIREKWRYIFFGSFPYEQHWRPLFAVIAMLAMLVMSADRRMWDWRRLLAIWSVGSFVTFLLMFGQLHIPLSLFLIVALVVGLVGMSLRKRHRHAVRGERLSRTGGDRPDRPGAAHRRHPAGTGSSPSRRSATSRPACGAASRSR